jgi:Protein of unknown function (DUF2970)
MSKDIQQLTQRPLSFVQTVKAVAWSFIGLRKGAGYQQDIQQLNPVHLIVAGIIGALLFVLTLVALVRWVVGSGVAG